MLLGNADVEAAVGEFLGEQIEPGAGRHRRGDGDDLVVLARFLDQAFGEHLGVLRRVRFRLHLRAGGDVELDHAVIFVGGFLRRRVAFALLRDDVHQDRAVFGIAHVAQNGQQVIEIVAIDRADIIEAKLVEQSAAGHEAAGEFLDPLGLGLEEFRQPARQLLADVAHRPIGLAGIKPRQISRHGADRRRNRHVVVVENDDQP